MGDVQMRNLLHFYQLCRKQGGGGWVEKLAVKF